MFEKFLQKYLSKMSEITNPHDKFFKASFSRLDVVQGFIEEVFPPPHRDKINLNSLKLSNATFTFRTFSGFSLSGRICW